MTVSRRNFLATALAAPAILSLPLGAAQAESNATPVRLSNVTYKVGDIDVIALSDGYLDLPTAMLDGFEPTRAKTAAAQAYQQFDHDNLRLGVNGFVIRTGDTIIAVDNGTPEVVAPTVGKWRDSLAQAGLRPEQIDIAFQTHLHMDHVGGLGTLGKSDKGLANAQLLVSQADWDFTHSDTVYAKLPDLLKGSTDIARALVAPYANAMTLLPMNAETDIAPGVTAVPMPGHSPGHMGLRITSGDDALLIWADALHAQAYQFAHPNWTLTLDSDLAQARATRARLLDAAASDRVRVAGSHLDFPAFGYVERSGDAYRYIPSTPTYG